MHCATLDIKAKVEYTLVSFMLSFRRPADISPCMPFILRSFPLLLIFPVPYMSRPHEAHMRPSVASFYC